MRSADTFVVHAGRPAAEPGAPLSAPIVLSSTYHQGGVNVYGRDQSPTWESLEEVIGGLEGGEAVSFASGMAAVSAVLEMTPTPARVVVGADSYNGTRRFLADVASRGRLRFRTVDISDTAAVLESCASMVEAPGRPSGAPGGFGAGGVLWLESPTNPLMAVADLAALCEGAHGLGMDVVVDNTFATPLLQTPLALGADVVVHSATKWIAGHSDVLIGLAVTARPPVAAALVDRRSLHGGIPGPFESWIALRGVRTLGVRLERAQANAGELSRRLVGHTGVERVRYPGLPDDPGHAVASVQMRGFGAMLSFDVFGGAEAADGVVGRLRLITAATSLGGVETTIERRGRHAGEEGTPPGLLRVSVGIEAVEDLWEDLEQALPRS